MTGRPPEEASGRLLRAPATRRAVPLLLAILGLAVAPAPARGQNFLEVYRAGLESVEEEDWETAERLMEAATNERAEAAERLIRYLHLKPYVPWFYLGLARYRQEDCPGALEAWDEAERQGVAADLDTLWPAAVDGRAACALRDRRREDARHTADELGMLLDRAEQVAEAAASLAEEGRAAGIWEQGNPSPAERLQRAVDEIAAGRRLVRDLEEADPSGRSLSDIAQEAESRTRNALETLQALRSQVESQREEVRSRIGNERDRLAAARSSASRLLARTEELGQLAPRVADARSDLREELDATEAIAAEAPLTELNRRRERIVTAATNLREIAAPPPDALVEAADAFFAGELERAVEILERPGVEDSSDARVRAHAALLRAAARFSLWQAGGGADLDLLEAARRDVVTAREEDPDLAPLPRAFSPRFLAFFEANSPEPMDEAE